MACTTTKLEKVKKHDRKHHFFRADRLFFCQTGSFLGHFWLSTYLLIYKMLSMKNLQGFIIGMAMRGMGMRGMGINSTMLAFPHSASHFSAEHSFAVPRFGLGARAVFGYLGGVTGNDLFSDAPA